MITMTASRQLHEPLCIEVGPSQSVMCLPACLPACSLACLPARLPACLLACLPHRVCRGVSNACLLHPCLTSCGELFCLLWPRGFCWPFRPHGCVRFFFLHQVVNFPNHGSPSTLAGPRLPPVHSQRYRFTRSLITYTTQSCWLKLKFLALVRAFLSPWLPARPWLPAPLQAPAPSRGRSDLAITTSGRRTQRGACFFIWQSSKQNHCKGARAQAGPGARVW